MRSAYRTAWLALTILLIAVASFGAAQPAFAKQGPPDHSRGRGYELPPLAPAPPLLPTSPLPDVPMPTPPSGGQGFQGGAATERVSIAATESTSSLALKILVISADGTEVTLPAIQQVLDYIGVPYTLWIASERQGQLTAAQLASGNHGFYQAVFLTTGNLAYTPDGGATWRSGLSNQEWQTLWAYEATFKVRQVSWYTFPTPDYGFASYTAEDTTVTPITLRLTTAGRDVFRHLNQKMELAVRNAFAYPAAITSGDPNIKALLTDRAGRVFAATRLYGDGRENLALTFSGNPYLVHTLALSYGLVSWATKGIFLGEFRIYAAPQVDDYFFSNDVFTTATPCGTDLNLTPSGVLHRMDQLDVATVVGWQKSRRSQATTGQLRLSMAFNGGGADPPSAGGTQPAGDTLVAATEKYRSDFFWVNHTYEHMQLNDPLVAPAAFTRQLELNHKVAQRLALPNYYQASLVTPEISGLDNQVFLDAAYAWGIRSLVSDTSRPGQGNPSPNMGYANALRPEIYTVPRRANNLFYNVTRPEEWVHEYNCIYSGFWGRALSFEEILDKESDMLLQYVLRADIDPWMFHQANLEVYSRSHTLLTDLLDAMLTKYNALFKLPIQSLNQHEIAEKMQARERYNAAGVQAVLIGNQLTITAVGDASVPITGVCTGVPALNASSDTYNGQCILTVPVSAGTPLTITAP
jgi:hypothetical protein